MKVTAIHHIHSVSRRAVTITSEFVHIAKYYTFKSGYENDEILALLSPMNPKK